MQPLSWRRREGQGRGECLTPVSHLGLMGPRGIELRHRLVVFAFSNPSSFLALSTFFFVIDREYRSALKRRCLPYRQPVVLDLAIFVLLARKVGDSVVRASRVSRDAPVAFPPKRGKTIVLPRSIRAKFVGGRNGPKPKARDLPSTDR